MADTYEILHLEIYVGFFFHLWSYLCKSVYSTVECWINLHSHQNFACPHSNFICMGGLYGCADTPVSRDLVSGFRTGKRGTKP
jgi:hypothetical protein